MNVNEFRRQLSHFASVLFATSNAAFKRQAFYNLTGCSTNENLPSTRERQHSAVQSNRHVMPKAAFLFAEGDGGQWKAS